MKFHIVQIYLRLMPLLSGGEFDKARNSALLDESNSKHCIAWYGRFQYISSLDMKTSVINAMIANANRT